MPRGSGPTSAPATQTSFWPEPQIETHRQEGQDLAPELFVGSAVAIIVLVVADFWTSRNAAVCSRFVRHAVHVDPIFKDLIRPIFDVRSIAQEARSAIATGQHAASDPASKADQG
jgi:hypothetical protein